MAWVMLMAAKAAPQADTLVSGNWVTGFVVAVIGAIFTGIAGFPFIKKRITEQALKEAHVTIKPPVPTIHTKEEVELVTKDQLDERIAHLEADIKEIKEALDGERSIARTANGNLHKRIDALSERLGERLSSLEGSTDSIKETVGKLLDLALNKKPGTR